LPAFDPNKIKGKYAYVLKLSNTGAFAAKPKVELNYPNHTLNPVINITANDGSDIYYTLDGSAPGKNSTHYTKPVTANSSGILSVRAFKNDVLQGNISTTAIHIYDWKKSINTGNVQQGLQLKKFNLESPRSTDELENAVAQKTIIASNISINDTLRRENTELIYEGFIKIPADGMYIFYLSSDDGSKLLIDKETVINNDGLHGDDEAAGKIALKKGYHSIKLLYFNATGGAGLQLLYGLEGSEKKKIPSALFYH